MIVARAVKKFQGLTWKVHNPPPKFSLKLWKKAFYLQIQTCKKLIFKTETTLMTNIWVFLIFSLKKASNIPLSKSRNMDYSDIVITSHSHFCHLIISNVSHIDLYLLSHTSHILSFKVQFLFTFEVKHQAHINIFKLAL